MDYSGLDVIFDGPVPFVFFCIWIAGLVYKIYQAGVSYDRYTKMPFVTKTFWEYSEFRNQHNLKLTRDNTQIVTTGLHGGFDLKIQKNTSLTVSPQVLVTMTIPQKIAESRNRKTYTLNQVMTILK